MSSSMSDRSSRLSEDGKRRKSSPSNVDFVQRYSQEEYSRAIPTNVLPQAKPRLGEYCVPVDSKPLQKKSSLTLEDYNRDIEPGYAQPHDSLLSSSGGRKDEDADSDDNGDVYELAKEAQEEYHVPPPPQKKPSPKPRKTFNALGERSFHRDMSKSPPSPDSDVKNGDDSPTAEYNLASATVFDPSQDSFPAERRRPPKKVVEIEYEVASEIRKSQPPGSVPPLSFPQRSPSHAGSISVSSKDIASNVKASQTHTSAAPNYPPPSPKAFQSPSQQFGQECLYEEPWDLKAKRLKQEQEEKKSMRKKSEGHKNVQVYEEAWDSPSRQRKLDEKLQLARTFSTASDSGDVPQAVADTSRGKIDSRHDPTSQPKNTSTNLQPQTPTDTYEDAWDLKNKILEERLSKIQMQATATYEEPWDKNKHQKDLMEKLQRTRQSAGDKPIRVGPNLSGPIIRSSSDARDRTSPEVLDAKANYLSSRGRHHSIDNSNMKSKSRSGVIGQRINPSIPLINQNWFHGNITREDAEQMLCVCKEGSFIVRISSDRKSYSLSIKSVSQNIHVQIEQSVQIDGSLRYILGKNSKEFTTIPEMIDYYTQHRVPLKGAEHITLLHPVECKWSQQS